MCQYRVVFHPSVISTLSSRFHSFSFTFSDFSYVEYFQMFSSRRDSNQSINQLLDDDDKNGDDGSQSKKRPVQPKAKAATQKTVCKGKRPAAKTKAKK